MKFAAITLLLCAISSAYGAPQSTSDSPTFAARDSSLLSSPYTLGKRKGGGGGRGTGGGSGGRTGGGGSYSGYSFSSSSNIGGRTREGSGTPKVYGSYYRGGAVVPYTAGAASPTRRLTPYLLPVGALAFFPGVWLYSAYAYPYPIGYHWIDGGSNLTSNVTCLCQEYSVCGCDPTDNSTFLANVLTNGSNSGAPINTTDVQTVDWGNGTIASYINGTLDNGTTADGGTDPSDESEVSPAKRLAVEFAGYWIMVATVVASVTLS